MGADIHMVVEVLDHDYGTGKDQWKCVVLCDGAYGNRNYILFSALAGVRSEDGVDPIAAPRGLPADISDLARKELSDIADHSHSWLTLGEVRAYSWDKSWRCVRTMDALNSARVFAGHPPLAWSGGIFGGQIKHVTEDEMRELVKRSPLSKWTLDAKCVREVSDMPAAHPLVDYFAEVGWWRTPREACSDFLTWVEALGCTRVHYEAPDRVRLVFGFDS